MRSGEGRRLPERNALQGQYHLGERSSWPLPRRLHFTRPAPKDAGGVRRREDWRRRFTEFAPHARPPPLDEPPRSFPPQGSESAEDASGLVAAARNLSVGLPRRTAAAPARSPSRQRIFGFGDRHTRAAHETAEPIRDPQDPHADLLRQLTDLGPRAVSCPMPLGGGIDFDMLSAGSEMNDGRPHAGCGGDLEFKVRVCCTIG